MYDLNEIDYLMSPEYLTEIKHDVPVVPEVTEAVEGSDAEARCRADGLGWLIDKVGCDPVWLDFVVSADYCPDSSDYEDDMSIPRPKKKTTDDHFRDCLAIIDSRGLLYDFEERSAILEFDGNLTRVDADRCAAFEVLNRRPR